MRTTLKTIVILSIATCLLGSFVLDDPISELTEKFNAHNAAFPQVKLSLSFNQPAYASGDTAFFKAYLLTEELKPVRGRQIVELSTIDSEGNEVNHQSFRIENGMAANQIYIPNDIDPGIYKVIAYTNWMKNFSSKLYYNWLLTISGENHFEFKSGSPLKIDLTAEGGSLIAGATTRVVAFASKGGMPVAANGRIVDSEGNEVIRFICDKTGLAEFELTLGSELTYRIEAEGFNSSIPFDREGYTLKVVKGEELINAEIQLKSKRQVSESVYVVLTSRSQINYTSMVSVNSDSPTSVVIPNRNIPEGIAQITLFDSKLNVLATRLVFIPSQNMAKVNLQLNHQSVHTRDPVSFEIDIKDQYGATKGADLFVSAYYKNLFEPVQSGLTLREQLLVGSDMPGSEMLLNQIDIDTKEGQAVLDKYLITKTWERYDWQDVLSNKKREPAFPAEGTLIYDGVATFRDSGKPVPDSTLVLLFLQKRTFGYEVYTGANGAVKWPVYFDFYGAETIMYSMERRGKRLENAKITLIKDSLRGFNAPQTVKGAHNNPYYNFNNVAKVVGNSFAYNWNKEEVKKSTANPNAAMEDELNGVDATINVDDYVVFPTIEDLFREVVRFVQNKKVAGKPTLRVLSSDSNNPIMGDPLYVVDGIATKNTEFIFSLKPGDIAVIKVVNNARKLRNLGSITKNGVIFFQTKIADIGQLIPKDDILYIEGLVEPLVKKNEQVESSATRTPILRSTVYWNTQFERNERGLVGGTINSADNTGTINLRVQGITTDGIPFDKTQTVEVSFQQPN